MKEAAPITTTHCCYCAMQCQMELRETPEGVSVMGVAHPINKGKLCVLGQNSAKVFGHAERLTSPLVRVEGRLEPTTWEAALTRVIAGFKNIRDRHGADANAVYSGASVSNEKAYLLGKFARVALGTRHVDYNGRYCMSAAAVAAQMAFGLDRGLNMPLDDIPKHDLIMIVGSNPAETLPIIMNYLLAAKRAGTKFIVVDPRKTTTANLATLHLGIKLGGDLALSNVLLKRVLELRKENQDFITKRTRDFDLVKDYLSSLSSESLLNETGLEPPQIDEAVTLLSEAENPLLLGGRGQDQNARGTLSTLALINLSLALGANYGTLTGQANGQGAREHGLKADQLPGYRSINDEADRAHVADVWGVAADELPGEGYSAFELFEALGRKEIRGLFVLGSNPVVSSPDKDKVKAWLSSAEQLVVVDSFRSETAELADVVLPGSLWAEETGTTTNLEGRVVLREALKPPPEGARRDLDIILELAQRLGSSHFSYPTQNLSEAIFNELRRATKGAAADYSGISYERLRAGDECFWPCTSETSSGVKRPFETCFSHPDGLAKFHLTDFSPLAESCTEDYPLSLTTGRYLMHYLTGNFTRRTELLSKRRPEPLVEIHPDTALALGLADGDFARLSTRRAAAIYKVKLSKKIRPDTLFVPIHWEGDQAANRLTIGALDPLSKMPEFKAAAAKLEPVTVTANSSANEELAREVVPL